MHESSQRCYRQRRRCRGLHRDMPDPAVRRVGSKQPVTERQQLPVGQCSTEWQRRHLSRQSRPWRLGGKLYRQRAEFQTLEVRRATDVTQLPVGTSAERERCRRGAPRAADEWTAAGCGIRRPRHSRRARQTASPRCCRTPALAACRDPPAGSGARCRTEIAGIREIMTTEKSSLMSDRYRNPAVQRIN